MNKTNAVQQTKTASSLSPAQGLLQRKCACGNHTVAGGGCAECAKKNTGLQRKLSIGASNDPLELEADRVADQVVANKASPLSVSNFASGQLQREEAPKEKTNEEKYQEGFGKLGEAFLETPLGKQLLEKIKQDALVKGAITLGKDIISTWPGKIYTGEAAIITVAALAATHKELPAQIPEIPLDILTPGLSVRLTYKGPVDKPTEAMITFKFTEQAPKGSADKKTISATDKYRAETARMAADQDKFRAGLRYPPGSPEDLQQKAEDEAVKNAALKYRGGPDIEATIKKYPWLAAPQPKNDLQLTMPKPSFGTQPPSLFGDEFKLKLPGEPKKKQDEPALQKKLSIGASNDSLEQEADRVADQVMATSRHSEVNTAPPRIQRFTGQASESLNTAPASVDRVLASPGRPLEPVLRQDMEQRFGYDFSRVRVHTDSAAEKSARDVNANAYNVGHNIVFDSGRFAPGTHGGRRLLAHELTHVVQQSSSNGILADYNNGKRDLVPSVPQAGRMMIQRQAIESDTNKDKQIDVSQLKYACVFVGQDLYGIQARRYVKTVLPLHYLIEASSMEDAMVKMHDHSQAALKGGAVARIAEVVLIAHGNATGFVKIPLIKGHKGTTPEELSKLQEDFQMGARQKFQGSRTDVIGLFDENTQVIVRGCRVGRSQEAVDALAAFFGGQATVYAAKEYQAFTRRKVSSFDKDPRQAAIKAFDHLTMQGFLPKEIVVTDDDKVRWVAGHLPDKYVPESFLVDESDVGKVRGAGADNAAIQSLKDYMSAQLIGVDKWGVSKPAEPEDPELDPMTAAEIVAMAGEKLADLRNLKKDSPEDWKSIGEKAWWVLRCHKAWSRKPEAMQINPAEKDPIAGLWMPGLSYNIDLLAMQAARRPDLKVLHSDVFATANLVMSAETPSEAVEEGLVVAEGQPKTQPDAQGTKGSTGQLSSHARGGGSGTKGNSVGGEVEIDADTITSAPRMPEPTLNVDLGTPGGKKAATALVVRGEFKRSFEIPYERNLWYLKVKKAVVEFNGKIDFKTEGEKELVIGAFGALASKPGERVSGGGDKLEATLVKGQDKQTGVSGKVTGGLDIGGQGRTKEGESGSSTARGMKPELYLGAQVAWGPIAEELKLVIVGIDETTSGTDMFTIFGIKWSPIVVQRDFELPVSDGTKVKFTGSVKLTIEAEPDWVRIAARLGQALGRQVMVAPGAITAGGTAAAGTAAETTGTAVGGAAVGELVIAGGFVAGAAALVYAYYKSAEEIEDLKELQRGSDQGVADFCGGYLAYLGIPGAGQPGGALWNEGQRHAKLNLEGRVNRAVQAHIEQHKPRILTDSEIHDTVLGGIKQDARSWRLAVYFSYETAIRTLFYKAWLARVKGTDAERNALNARARAGLSSVNPTEEPDYGWVNAVGGSGAAGMRRPTHAR